MALSSNLTGAALSILAFGAYAAYDMSAKFLGGGIHPMQIIAVSGLIHIPLLLAYAAWDRGALWPKAPKLMALRAVGTVINFTAGVSAFTMLPLAEAYALTGAVMQENMAWRNTEEGIAAFLEKRAPDWPR